MGWGDVYMYREHKGVWKDTRSQMSHSATPVSFMGKDKDIALQHFLLSTLKLKIKDGRERLQAQTTVAAEMCNVSGQRK